MKDFTKLTKETWKFYLMVFMMFLFFVVWNGIFLCHDNMVLQYKEGEKLPATGTAFTYLVSDKSDFMLDILGIKMVAVAMIIVLFIRHFVFINKGTAEFQQFLPVKQRNRVLHDYFMLLGITVILNIVFSLILLIGQSVYNLKMIKQLFTQNAQEPPADFLFIPNVELLKYCACYMAFTLLLFHILYLGMLLCKNSLAGMLIAMGIWKGGLALMDFLYGEYLEVYYNNEMWRTGKIADAVVYIFELLERALNPESFWEFASGTIQYEQAIFVTLGIILLISLFIWLVSGKRELSKGKFFYFRWTEVLFAAACAIGVGAVLYEQGVMGLAGSIVFALLFGILVWYCVKPGGTDERRKWEVK